MNVLFALIPIALTLAGLIFVVRYRRRYIRALEDELRAWKGAADSAEEARKSTYDIFVRERGHRVWALRSLMNLAVASQQEHTETAEDYQSIIESTLEMLIEIERTNAEHGIVLADEDAL